MLYYHFNCDSYYCIQIKVTFEKQTKKKKKTLTNFKIIKQYFRNESIREENVSMEATQYDRVSEVANVNQYASIAAFSTPPDNYDRVSTMIDPSINLFYCLY